MGSVESEVSVARAESSGSSIQRLVSFQPLVRATNVSLKRVRVLHVDPLMSSVMWRPQERVPRRPGSKDAGKRLDLDARLVVERAEVALGTSED